jgi:hypothetical protein
MNADEWLIKRLQNYPQTKEEWPVYRREEHSRLCGFQRLNSGINFPPKMVKIHSFNVKFMSISAKNA